jgi:hypothetical protein
MQYALKILQPVSLALAVLSGTGKGLQGWLAAAVTQGGGPAVEASD